jgi:hypothetical protein
VATLLVFLGIASMVVFVRAETGIEETNALSVLFNTTRVETVVFALTTLSERFRFVEEPAPFKFIATETQLVFLETLKQAASALVEMVTFKTRTARLALPPSNPTLIALSASTDSQASLTAVVLALLQIVAAPLMPTSFLATTAPIQLAVALVSIDGTELSVNSVHKVIPLWIVQRVRQTTNSTKILVFKNATQWILATIERTLSVEMLFQVVSASAMDFILLNLTANTAIIPCTIALLAPSIVLATSPKIVLLPTQFRFLEMFEMGVSVRVEINIHPSLNVALVLVILTLLAIVERVSFQTLATTIQFVIDLALRRKIALVTLSGILLDERLHSATARNVSAVLAEILGLARDVINVLLA